VFTEPYHEIDQKTVECKRAVPKEAPKQPEKKKAAKSKEKPLQTEPKEPKFEKHTEMEEMPNTTPEGLRKIFENPQNGQEETK
jgi:hypothetical protein